MERRVLIEDDAPVVRRPLADAPAEGVATAPVQGDLWEDAERAFQENDTDRASGYWHLEWIVWDRTSAFAAASGVLPEKLLPGHVKFTPWSTALPPSRGWWLVREKPGGEVSVLWFERVGRLDDGSWHLEGDGSEGFPKGEPGLCLGMHSAIGNVEWCGLAEPWPEYPYELDAALMDYVSAEWREAAAIGAPLRRVVLL